MKKEVFALVVIVLFLTGVAAVEVKEAYNINEELIPNKIVIPESADYFAIKYTPTVTYNLQKVELFTVGFTNATLQIREDNNNKPGTTKADIDFFIGGPYEEWKGRSFSQSITVEKDKPYWVVITSPLMIVPMSVEGTQFTYLTSNDGVNWQNESKAPFMLIFNGEGDQAPAPGGGGGGGGGGGSGGPGGNTGNPLNNESNTGGSEEPIIEDDIITDLKKITDEIKKRPVLLLSLIFGFLGIVGIVVIFFIIRIKREHKQLLKMSQQELSQKMSEQISKDTTQQEQQIEDGRQNIKSTEMQSNLYVKQEISQNINKEEITKNEIKQLIRRGYEYLKINQKSYAEDTYKQIQEKYTTLSSIDEPLYNDIIQFYTYITNAA